MKTTLLKMFRKRFEVITFGATSYALLDHKEEKVIYKVPYADTPLVTRSMAIWQGITMILSTYEFQKFVTTRRKRVYRSFLTK